MKPIRYVTVFTLALFALPPLVSASSSIKSTSVVNQHASKINLNTASVSQLTHAIRGIGPKRAEAIVAYRQAHGAFQAVTEIARIKGIGRSFVKQHAQEIENRLAVG